MSIRALVLVLILFGSGCEPCPREERGSLASPDGAFTAVELFGNCGGATIPFSTQVVVRPAAGTHRDYREARIMALDGDIRVMMEWTSPRVLKLIIPKSVRNVWHRGQLDDITVVLVH